MLRSRARGPVVGVTQRRRARAGRRDYPNRPVGWLPRPRPAAIPTCSRACSRRSSRHVRQVLRGRNFRAPAAWWRPRWWPGAARRPRADARRFGCDGDQRRAQSRPRLRSAARFHADHRAGTVPTVLVVHPSVPARTLHDSSLLPVEARPTRVRLGGAWLDPPSHDGDLRGADRHRASARALSRRHQPGEA